MPVLAARRRENVESGFALRTAAQILVVRVFNGRVLPSNVLRTTKSSIWWSAAPERSGSERSDVNRSNAPLY
jgi:hypothetical protein